MRRDSAPPRRTASNHQPASAPGRAASSTRSARRSTAALRCPGDHAPSRRRRAAAGHEAGARPHSRCSTGVSVIDSSRRSAPASGSAFLPARASENRRCSRCSPARSGSTPSSSALVGERGREVREFIEDVLGDNRASAVTVVSTGDESPMMRRLAPKTAMAVAEYFRDRGEKVLLIVDSVTRFAHAAREVALAAGEPPVARGYAPSVFTDLPQAARARRARRGRRRARSPAFSRCWSTATTTTIRSPTPSAARSTGTSCSTARSPIRAAIRPSTCSTSISRLARLRLDARAARAGHEAARHDRPIRGYARLCA